MTESRSILIKKYENRRLYDTVNSRYINLDEVSLLLRQGFEVRVVDAITGQDITRLVLTQIIVEDAKTPNSTFPIEILRQMVVASGKATETSTRVYMQAFADIYEKSMRALAPALPFTRPPEPAPNAAPKPAGDASPAGAAEDGSMEELKRRLAELEQLVATLSPDAVARRES